MAVNKSIVVHWWDAPPYIFKKSSKIDGIIPATFGSTGTTSICGSQVTIDYSTILDGYAGLLNVTNHHAQHISNATHLYAPVYTNIGHVRFNDFVGLPMANSTHQTILVRSFYHSLIYRGLVVGTANSCIFFLVMAFLLSVFGFLAWLVEHRERNSYFHRYFSRGIWNGLYWAIVTMTTVGYGDIVTKTPAGKFLSVMWMLVSVVLCSSLTAMLTSGIDGPVSLEGHRVAHLNGIAVFKDISRERGISVGYNFYNEIFNCAHNGDCFAALADRNTVAFEQDNLWNNDLLVDKSLDLLLSVEIKVPKQEYNNSTEFWNCVGKFLRANGKRYLNALKVNKHRSTLTRILHLSKVAWPIFIVHLVLMIVLICYGTGTDLWHKFKDNKNTEKVKEDINLDKSSKEDVGSLKSVAYGKQLAQARTSVRKMKEDLEQQQDILRQMSLIFKR